MIDKSKIQPGSTVKLVKPIEFFDVIYKPGKTFTVKQVLTSGLGFDGDPFYLNDDEYEVARY